MPSHPHLSSLESVSIGIARMSDEEMEKQAKLWEEEGRREKEKIKKRKKLLTI